MSIQLGNTLGAAFIGNLIAGVLYGITCTQAYRYYREKNRDSKLFRWTILLLLMLDTVHIAMISHATYFYVILNYGNFLSLTIPNWSIIAPIYVSCISDFIIRTIFGKRVWFLTNRNKFLGFAICSTAIITPVFGFVCATRAFAIGTFLNFHRIAYLFYLGLGSGMVADLFIAGSLCYTLSKGRTGFKKTDNLLNVLIRYSVNTSLLTCVCAMASFISYALWPDTFIYISIYVSLSKLYLNSLLATLNSREYLSDKIQGVIGVPLSNLSGHSWKVFDGSPGSGKQTDSQVVDIC